MNTEGKIIIQNLGFFFIGILLLLINLMGLIFCILINKILLNRRIARLIDDLRQNIFWGAFIALIIEGYLDFSLFSLLNLEDLTPQNYEYHSSLLQQVH